MNLSFNVKLADKYKSLSQKAKILTESWVNDQIYCPNCGHLDIDKYANNKPVADFFCSNCREDYELKSKKDSMGNKIIDGAYGTMIERLKSSNNPNFFFLNYDLGSYKVQNFTVIPKHFFVSEIIVKRNKGIKDRPEYIMCSIDLKLIPQSGKIFYIKNGFEESKEKVLESWKKTLFLREEKETNAKGWLLDVMMCVEKLNKKVFTLNEVYAFENLLSKKHPDNRYIKDKIRQQLQVLRDKGYLEFTSRGNYRLK